MIGKILGICCPWFWPSGSLNQYHKKIQQNENQSFMKQVVDQTNYYSNTTPQSNHDTRHSHKTQLTNRTIDTARDNHEQDASTISIGIVPPEIYNIPASYMDCVPGDHPYRALLSSKLQLLPNLFNLQVEPESKLPENDYNLKIYTKQSADEKTNMFVYSFVFPTTYELYEEMQNNFQLQKSFDANIDQYDCTQKLDDATKLIYLSYKKILIVSPRDFVYVRYVFKKNNENCSIATSLPDAEQVQGKTRGSIILTATRAIQRQGKLQLTVYSQVDMKMPVKASAAKVRGVTEIKKYLDNCYKYVQQQQQNII